MPRSYLFLAILYILVLSSCRLSGGTSESGSIRATDLPDSTTTAEVRATVPIPSSTLESGSTESPIAPALPFTPTQEPDQGSTIGAPGTPGATLPRGDVRTPIDRTNLDRIRPILQTETAEGSILAVAISPDGSLLAAGTSTGRLLIYRLADGSLLADTPAHSAAINTLAFTPEGTWLASGSDDRLVRIWNTDDFTQLREFSTSLEGRVLKLLFSPNEPQLAIGGHLCFFSLRNVTTGILRRTIIQPGCQPRFGGSVEFWGADFFENGEGFVTGDGQPNGSGGSLQSWQVDSYTDPRLIRGYDLVIRDLDIHPDEKTLAVALVGRPEIWILRLEDGSLIQTLEGHQFRVNALRYFPDGSILASGSRDGTVILWDAASGADLLRLTEPGFPVNTLAIAQDGSLIAAGDEGGGILVWGIGE